MQDDLIVTNIQRMSMKDGPGNRTTVFLKGCALRCPWCSNPENLFPYIEYYYNEKRCFKEKCIYHDSCKMIKGVPLSELSEEDCDKCYTSAIGKYGKRYSAGELFDEIIKDKIYWDHCGGVTFSGGEALLQANQLVSLLKLLKSEGVHIAFETSLYAPTENLLKIVNDVDFFYVDVKILEENEYRDVLGGDVELYKKNMNILKHHGSRIVFRIPCSDEYFFNEQNVSEVKKFLSQYNDIPIEVFAIHNLGESKYKLLNKKFSYFEPSKNIDEFVQDLKNKGLQAERIQI